MTSDPARIGDVFESEFSHCDTASVSRSHADFTDKGDANIPHKYLIRHKYKNGVDLS